MSEEVKSEGTDQFDKQKEVWQMYLQKCCEFGQLQHALDQLDSQRKEIEKKIEITFKDAKKQALLHRDIQKAMAEKVQLPKPEETQEAH